MNLNRRNFLRGSTLLGAGALASRTAQAQHEQHQQHGQPQKPKAPPPKAPPQPEAPPVMKKPSSGPAYVPVETPDVPQTPLYDGGRREGLSPDGGGGQTGISPGFRNGIGESR